MRWIAVLAAAGCAEPQVADPVRTWDGPFLIDEVVIDCDGNREWTYDVRAQGWGEEITVDVVARAYGSLIHHEHHGLVEVDYGEDWSQYRAVLDQVDDPADVVEGASTAFACDGKTYLTYGIAAWRYDGDLEECVAWGVDPAGEFPDCVDWGTNGHRR